MPLDRGTQTEIHDFLFSKVSSYVDRQKAKGDPMDIQPFHARLLPELFKIPLSERSFSTSSGSWFQHLAKFVATQYHATAELQHTIHDRLQPAASSYIEEILNRMNHGSPRRKPSREKDTSDVLKFQSPGGADHSVTADLFIKTRKGEEWYFEMKTAQPNKGQCRDMKKFILQVAAMRQAENGQAYASMAYNPRGDGQEIKDGKIKQFLEVGTDMLIGRDFWSKIGDQHTYGELLAITESVGAKVKARLG